MKIKFLILLSLTLPFAFNAEGGSATWNLNPTSGDWNTATNWTPNTVPNGPSDTATFSLSTQTGISLSAITTVNGIVFDPGASAFTITASPDFPLTIGNAGVTNNSGMSQNFVVANRSNLFWTGNATAGSGTIYTSTGRTQTYGLQSVIFFDESSAGDGTFINEPGLANGEGGGYTQFYDHSTAGTGTFFNQGSAVAGAGSGYIEFGVPSPPGSTAGNGKFTLNGGTGSFAFGGQIDFYCYTTAGNATFTINGGTVADALPAIINFFCDATADNATLVANGGLNGAAGGAIHFAYQALGSSARVELFGNSSLDISLHDAPGMSIGSVEGDGLVFLGGNDLAVGGNGLDMRFSGVIQDGGSNGGTGGSLTKAGSGKLSLAGASTYMGGTTIEGGKLVVNNMSGSGTGSGTVRVNAGVISGRGTIAGAVIVGTGSGSGAGLAPGRRGRKTDTLTIQNTLTFQLDSTFTFELKATSGAADKVVANGVTINSGALFSFIGLGSGTLTVGTVFTAISNASAAPISGTFANLADGATITVGSNTFQANYEGGDGNDLTLTVVP